MFANSILTCLVVRIRPMRSIKAVEPVAGPSKSPKQRSKEGKKGKKKTSSNREVEESRPMDEDEFMCRRCIVERIVNKKVEIEMLWKEIEALEEMLEE